MLIYLINGDLPWRCIEATTKEDRYEKIMVAKEAFHKSDVLYKIPRELTIFLKNARKLEFTEKPNYKELKGLLEQIMLREAANNLKIDIYNNKVIRPR